MHDLSYLVNVVTLLSAAVVIVALFKRLHLSPVLGYLVAGATIGPHGFAIIQSSTTTSTFAEFGIVFLLFAIGLELSFERLKSMRAHVFGFGSLQVVTSAAIIGFFAYYGLGFSKEAAIIIGGGLALSSTAIVLQVLIETGRQSTQVGRLALAILLLQDFAVILLLILVPLLGGEQSTILHTLADAGFNALIALVAILVIGKLVIRPIYHIIGSMRNEELFVATTLLTVLGTSYLTESMGLSLALGAFLAGTLIAETEFQHQVEVQIMPFKGLLLGLFFMTVGMTIDLAYIVEELSTILSIVLFLLMGKALIIIALCLLFRIGIAPAIHAGLLLCQGGEFAFILFGIASEQGILDANTSQTLLMVISITMALTPLLSEIGHFIARRIEKFPIISDITNTEYTADLDNHIIIAGFGSVGKIVAKVLSEEKINYVVIDVNPNTVKKAREDGFPAVCGDISNHTTQESIGMDRANLIILTTKNFITISKSVKRLHKNYGNIPIIVRDRNFKHYKQLTATGPTIVVPEAYEAGLQIAGKALQAYGIEEQEIYRVKIQFRAGNYGLFTNIETSEDT